MTADFASALPPDPASEDGFRNSSETLHLAGSQLRTYLDTGRRALDLATACDIRLCSPNAQFALQDVKWGFHACDGGLVRLPRIVGMGHAMDIVLSGERVDAEHALRIGLVNRIHPAGELLQRALDYAQTLARRAPLAQRLAKDVMRRTAGMDLAEALRLESSSFHDLAHTEDLAEGTSAFAQRREAQFKGR